MKNRFETLELQGFKTFATLTRLEFPGQITAIVGPNGSGKSNIADGVRWVLGEQAYTLLRAKRTEDMIFSGSQQRSRAGMASTTITFNNVDGWLPIDYSMVSISRRAYRDGQNEYLLNGQKVRLKDISEILSQTGLAERTYTIIGQGLVDIALALKPDERRKLFEEAAGIGLYRSRKEDALRRLSKTERNLERVYDILTEIKPRLRSLEKQAGRFEEFEQVRSELLRNLQTWYGFQWHHSQSDLEKIEKIYQEQESLLAELQNKFDDCKFKDRNLKSVLQEKSHLLEGAQTELIHYQRQYEEISREIAIVEERQNAFQNQKQSLQADISKFSEELKNISSDNKSFELEINQLQEDLNDTDKKANQSEIELAEVSSKRETIQAKLDIARQTRINHETRKVQLSVRIEELENRITSLSMEQDKIEKGIASLEKEKLEASGNEQVILEGLEKTQQRLLAMKSELNAKSEDLDTAYDENQALEHQIAQHETKSAKVQAQLEVLNQAEEALSGYSEGSKTIVEGSQKGRLPGGIVPLSKFFIVEEEYEKAISAALGELTDLLIVPSRGKDVLIQFLESKANDRVALIMRNEISSSKKSSQIKSKDGFLGFANEMVKAETRYQHLVDQLLSDTVVVKDRISAEKILPTLSGSQKVVTLQGLVFQANGVLISGQSRSGKRISRTRHRNEMQQEIKNLDEQLDKLQQDKIKISQGIQNLEQAFQSLQQKNQTYQDKQNDFVKQDQEIKAVITRLDEQLSWHKNQLAETRRQLTENQTKHSLTASDLEACHEEIEALISEEKTGLEKLNSLSVFDLQQNLNYWKTHRIVAKNSLKAAQQRYEDHSTRVSEAQQRLEHYQSRLSHLENSIIELRKNETQLKVESDNLASVKEKINADQVSPLSAEVTDLEEKIAHVTAQTSEVQNEIIPAERKLTQVQLELIQKKDRVVSLEDKIEDDFGLVMDITTNGDDADKILSEKEKIIKSLPAGDKLPENIDAEIKKQKRRLRGIGAINPEARQEYIEVKERYEFLEGQIIDLQDASKNLQEVIEALDDLMERDFLKTFKAVGIGFTEYFKRLFNGGDAKLLISDEDNPVEGGIDLEVRLPGRRQQGLALLSGGERSLTAVALIFALLKVSPTPFCILDEVDAMLDESNVGRFIELLRELSQNTQFIIITHNRNTVQAADVIYGVTMGRDATSQMISLKLEDVDETFVD